METQTNYSPEEVQKAKDFIWNWMDDGNKELIIGMATMQTHERHGLYVKQIFVEMEGIKTGQIVTRERMVIGLQYSPQPSHASHIIAS